MWIQLNDKEFKEIDAEHIAIKFDKDHVKFKSFYPCNNRKNIYIPLECCEDVTVLLWNWFW